MNYYVVTQREDWTGRGREWGVYKTSSLPITKLSENVYEYLTFDPNVFVLMAHVPDKDTAIKIADLLSKAEETKSLPDGINIGTTLMYGLDQEKPMTSRRNIVEDVPDWKETQK